MLFVVQGIPQELKVTTVVLEADPLHSDLLSMFHCPHDGKSLFQYSGNVVMLLPGGVKTNLPFLEQCRLCKNRFLIHSII